MADLKKNKKLNPTMMGRLPYAWIPRIDRVELAGNLAEDFQRKAASISLCDLIDGLPVIAKTEVFLSCDDDALYLGIRAHSPGGRKDRVEIFLEPYQDTLFRPYHHLMIEADGAYRADRTHTYSKYGSLNLYKTRWTPRLRVRVNEVKGCRMYTICLPYSQFIWDVRTRERKTLWRMNIVRSCPAGKKDRNATKQGAVLSAWSPTGVSTFHMPERFGYVLPEVFSTPGLLAKTRKSCTQSASDKLWLTLPGKSFFAKLDKQVKLLGSTSPKKRDEACKILKKLSGESLSAPLLVQGKVHASRWKFHESGNTRGSRAVFEMEDWCVQNQVKDDPDPLPKEVASSIRQATTPVGKMDFWYSVPKNFSKDKMMPLIVFYHGSHQWARRQIGGLYTAADPHGIMVACLQDDFYENSLALKADITFSLIEFLKKRFPINERRIMLSGHSRGGYQSSLVGLTNPDVFRFVNLSGMALNPRLDHRGWAKLDEMAKKSTENLLRPFWDLVEFSDKNKEDIDRSFQNNWIQLYWGENDVMLAKYRKEFVLNESSKLSFAPGAFSWIEDQRPPHFTKRIVPNLGHSPVPKLEVDWFLASMAEAGD